MSALQEIALPACLSIVIGLAACRDRKPAETFNAPPAPVVESFQHFVDSVSPQLYKVLDSAGIHAGSSDTSGDGRKPEAHVSQQTSAEARAQIYEAVLSLTQHEHLGKESGFAMPRNIFLQFTSIGDATKWALLTSKGYAFTTVTASNRNDLPLDLELGVRNVFRTRIEFTDWMAFRRAKLGKTGNAGHTP